MPPTTTLRTRIPWQDDSELVDSHARRYMGVALYQSRLRLLAPPTTRSSPLALECSRTLGRMLQGKERIYDVHSTRAAQRDPQRFVSERDMLRTIDALAQRALDQAGAALLQLPALRERFGGWFLLLERWPALENLDALLDSLGQFSHPYLLWVEQVRQASAPTQRALRAYLDSEFHLNAIAHNPEVLQAAEHANEQPREVADARRQFDLVRNNMSAAVRRLVALRSQGFEATRFAFEESRVGRGNDTRPYAAWPFPLRLMGVEDGETLAAAVASYQVLGAWMAGCGANLRFVESTVPAAAKRRPANSAGEQAAQALWRAVHEAGEALAWLGAALHALVRVEASAHCQQCFRHVGLHFRKYCERHARPDDGATRQDRPAAAAAAAATASTTATATATVHARTQHRHSTLLAAQFRAQFERLHADLARKPVWREPTQALERALARSRSRAGRKPQALGSSWAERADDIVVLVDALRPVLGEALTLRMQALQGALAAWAGADSQEAVQRAESLTPGGFFAHWFSGFSQTVGRKQLLHVGTDPTHPMTAWKLVASGKYNTPLRRLSPLNFDSIVRDLLLHRAWLEVGGEQADAALLRGGAPLPGLKPASRVDLVAARQMREVQGLSFEAIGKTFGVSRAAVYLALKRAG
ncbi:hypothetical protein DIC66_11705 [Rhodoferax lacus]|uniref:Uncharacterized protein n=1 Tax=Rhodoferax lacus TaxID=2184758 RepID=A0A3E1RBD9_9BURK|nr:hypothetical protein [Rhodoferax lacus]RFO96678.1 hypothetical protein DIC66_11705 [Rhodoferax lacus]